jgi:hypothetical protein
MGIHLEHEEARAILILTGDPNWAMFKEYVERRYIMARNDCEDVKDDHRYYQGQSLILKEMATIEIKAKNILSGH